MSRQHDILCMHCANNAARLSQVYGLPTIILVKDGEKIAGTHHEGAITQVRALQHIQKEMKTPPDAHSFTHTQSLLTTAARGSCKGALVGRLAETSAGVHGPASHNVSTIANQREFRSALASSSFRRAIPCASSHTGQAGRVPGEARLQQAGVKTGVTTGYRDWLESQLEQGN